MERKNDEAWMRRSGKVNEKEVRDRMSEVRNVEDHVCKLLCGRKNLTASFTSCQRLREGKMMERRNEGAKTR